MKESTFRTLVKIFGILLLAFMVFISFVNTGENIGGDHYNNMHDGDNFWQWVGLGMLVIGGTSLFGFYDLDNIINNFRGQHGAKKDTKTMYIRAFQFIFIGVGIALMAA